MDPAVLGDHDGEGVGHLKGHIIGHRMCKNHPIEVIFRIRHFLLFRLLRRATENDGTNDDLLWLPVDIMTVLIVVEVGERLFVLLVTSKPSVFWLLKVSY